MALSLGVREESLSKVCRFIIEQTVAFNPQLARAKVPLLVGRKSWTRGSRKWSQEQDADIWHQETGAAVVLSAVALLSALLAVTGQARRSRCGGLPGWATPNSGTNDDEGGDGDDRPGYRCSSPIIIKPRINLNQELESISDFRGLGRPLPGVFSANSTRGQGRLARMSKHELAEWLAWIEVFYKCFKDLTKRIIEDTYHQFPSSCCKLPVVKWICNNTPEPDSSVNRLAIKSYLLPEIL